MNPTFEQRVRGTPLDHRRSTLAMTPYFYPGDAEMVRYFISGDPGNPAQNIKNLNHAIDPSAIQSRKNLPKHYEVNASNRKHVQDYLEDSGMYNFTVLPPDVQNYIWDMAGTTRKKYENDILGFVNPKMVYDELNSSMYEDWDARASTTSQYFLNKYSHKSFTNPRDIQTFKNQKRLYPNRMRITSRKGENTSGVEGFEEMKI